MAKAGFWMQGAKGKIANAVFFKGQNGTVQRQNVTPSNPRTQAQLYNRIIFQTVTAAKNALLPLINISFEGMTKREAQQYFTKTNFAGLRSKLKWKIEQGFGVDETPYISFLPRGINVFTPNPLLIAKGSIASNTCNILFDEEDGVFAGRNAHVKHTTTSSHALLKQLFNIDPKSQVTFVYDDITNESLYHGSASGQGVTLLKPDIKIIRLVVGEDKEITLAGDTEENFAGSLVTAISSQCFDTEKSSSEALEMIERMVAGATYTTGDEGYWVECNDGGETHLAGAVIYSKMENNEWKISDTEMVIYGAQSYYLLDHLSALASWAPNGIPTTDGNFLEQGGSNNEL